MSLRDFDSVVLDELRQQQRSALQDMELFGTVIQSIEAMSPEGRAMLIARLARIFPQLGAQQAMLPLGPVQSDRPVRRPSLQALDVKTMKYADAVAVILDNGGQRPLSTKTLMLRLARYGKPVGSNDPYRTLYRSLAKDGRFMSLGGRWSLKDWYAHPAEHTLTDGERAAAAEALKSEGEDKQ